MILNSIPNVLHFNIGELYLFEGELDAVSGMVDGYDTNTDMLVEADYIGGIGDAAISHFRDMYKSVFMDSQIHKGSEIGDVRNNTRQHHPHLQVVNSMYRLVEMKLLYLRARVTRGFFQFVQNVSQGRETYF